MPTTELEQRISSGDWTECDVEWVSFLNSMLAHASIVEFAVAGVPAENVRRLLGVLALEFKMKGEAA
jgi:hypothetical protein